MWVRHLYPKTPLVDQSARRKVAGRGSSEDPWGDGLPKHHLVARGEDNTLTTVSDHYNFVGKTGRPPEPLLRCRGRENVNLQKPALAPAKFGPSVWLDFQRTLPLRRGSSAFRCSLCLDVKHDPRDDRRYHHPDGVRNLSHKDLGISRFAQI